MLSFILFIHISLTLYKTVLQNPFDTVVAHTTLRRVSSIYERKKCIAIPASKEYIYQGGLFLFFLFFFFYLLPPSSYILFTFHFFFFPAVSQCATFLSLCAAAMSRAYSHLRALRVAAYPYLLVKASLLRARYNIVKVAVCLCAFI